jgi:hypothetical protein
MKRLVLLLLLVAAAAFLATRWPRVNEAVAQRSYGASEEQVARAAKAAIERSPRWRFVGAGSGAAGHAVQAVYKTQLGLEHDVSLKIKREGAQTRLSVKSKSRTGPIDFGHNARVISLLLAAIERELAK